jgi:hypothetical protein
LEKKNVFAEKYDEIRRLDGKPLKGAEKHSRDDCTVRCA